MTGARLILTCGLPGSGKTTLARELAADRGAVRLTKNDWQRASGSSPWDRDVGAQIEQQLWRLAQERLGLGVSVVLDFGLWLEVPPDELWRRIAVRNTAAPWDSEPIMRADLDGWQRAFQAPDVAELALFDPPPRLAR